MPVRRRAFPQRRSPPNRSWAALSSTAVVGVSTSTKVLVSSLSLSNPNIDETLLRNVGRILVKSDQVAATEVMIGAFGMIVVTDLAVAAGAASIPGPITDAADDGWLLYVPLVSDFTFVTAAGFSNTLSSVYDFDSKAKRKTGEGQKIAVMVENASASFQFQIALVMRTLSMVTGI